MYRTKLTHMLNCKFCENQAKVEFILILGRGIPFVQSFGSRLVSGNSHEHNGPVVMEMESAKTKIHRVFFANFFLRVRSRVLLQLSAHN